MKIKMYKFKLGIKLNNVKKNLKKLNLISAKCFTVETIQNVKYISFKYDKAISCDLEFKIKNILYPKIINRKTTLKTTRAFNRNSYLKKNTKAFNRASSRKKQKVNYDDSIDDSLIELLLTET